MGNRAGVDAIEAIFCFETKTGRGSGVLRLVPTPGNPENFASWVLLTTLDEIKGHEEQIGARRPRGEEWSGGFGSEKLDGYPCASGGVCGPGTRRGRHWRKSMRPRHRYES